MRRSSDSGRRACTAIALLAAVATSFLCAAPAFAVRHQGGGTKAHGHRGSDQGGRPSEEISSKVPPVVVGGTAIAASKAEVGSAKQDLSSEGQVEPLSGLGLHNPVCDRLDEIRDRGTRISCESTGTPENDYPSGNYGFDVFITTGVTHPIGDLSWGLSMGLQWLWGGLRFVLNLILLLLGFAFNLNPFAEGHTMSEISSTIERVYERVTDPWLSTLIVVGGIWFAYKGLVQRQAAAGVAGTLAAIAMLVVGLWVIHQPRESVGRLARISDEVALEVISAPRTGSVARPAGSYAEAMSGVWRQLIEVPFAGMDFSDLRWAMGPPPREAVERADVKFCDDIGALSTLAVLAELGSEEARKACASIARRRYGRPKRIIDLYLRSSPNSPSREALWDYFNGDDKYKAKVAAQGGDGVLMRGSMLAIFALGLLGSILLLLWLSIRLFTQAAIAFVLLLVAPFALFFPFLGDSGRRAFKTWGLSLLGAIAAKVIYAAFLSVVLLGLTILGHVGSVATGFLLSSAFAWAILLKRAELLTWVSIEGSPSRGGSGGGMGNFAALAMARRMAEKPVNTVGGVRHRAGQWRRARSAEGSEATRLTARDQLKERARALADERYQEARRVVAQGAAGSSQAGSSPPPSVSSSPARQSGAAGGRKQSAKGERPAPPRPEQAGEERLEQARNLLAHVEHNQRAHGQRWSDEDLERYCAEDRKLLKGSEDPARHAHRIGMGRREFEGLSGPEYEKAAEEVEQARKRDLKQLDVLDDVPGRVPSRARYRYKAEKRRQKKEPDGAERRVEHLKSLRRDRRARRYLSPRRNLSRGA
jgi:hypothetical protein